MPANPRIVFYVVNFDKTGEPGSHWVCVEVTKRYCIYFDSYGKKPPPLDELHKFLEGRKLRRNRRQLQHKYSTTCGQWCMYFIWRKSTGWNMRNITAPFKKQTLLLNDHMMNHFIKKKFQIEKKVIDRPFLKKQIRREMAQNIAEWGGARMKEIKPNPLK